MATNKIAYRNYVFHGADIREGNPYSEVSLPSSSLGSNTIQVTVKCSDPSIVDFQRNDPLLYTRGDKLPERYFVQSISRVGTNRYTISATSIVGLLEQMEHKGGIYTGQTVPEVVAEICGSLPVHVKTIFADTALYGWLPYVKPPESSARDNLAQVLFAIGAYLGVDQEGVLRVEPLWDGVSSAVTADRVYLDGSVEYGSAVSAVSVLEHQYLALNTKESTTLFDGTATANTTVIFDEPMFNLQATGFSILESGANYAILSAGTGTLTGIPYLHTTREVVRSVTQGAAENIRTISDATLVSLVNSQAVAERLAEYYSHTVTIHNPILTQSEQAGYVVSIFDPYGKAMVDACISSIDITMSSKARAETSALVGFKPPQPGEIPYYDSREVLTGSGTWTVPAGVTSVEYVLFSGAQGGQAGLKGGDSGGSVEHNYQIVGTITGEVTTVGRVVLWGGAGGVGGQGGEGGLGSRIIQGNVSVTPGQQIAYACGPGGTGAAYNAGGAASGENGADTTFGSASTAGGTAAPADGWTDPVTGDIYATSGLSGLPGGNGAGAKPGYTIPENSHDLNEILVYQPSTAALDENGTVWPGAPTKEGLDDGPGPAGVAWHPSAYTSMGGVYGAASGYALGPGGVAGVTQATPTQRNPQSYGSAEAYDGLTPPAPSAIPAKPQPTHGGRGGYGGGGGSCPTWAGAERTRQTSFLPETIAGSPGVGGPGGQGGPGGDGLIILYYQTPGSPVLVEAAVTDDQKWRLDKYGRRCIV